MKGRIQILVVGTDEKLLRICKEGLPKHGYEVATTGEKDEEHLRKLIEQLRPVAIILDLTHGIGELRTECSIRGFSDVSIIAVTSAKEPGMMQTLDSEDREHLGEPFGIPVLAEEIKKARESRGATYFPACETAGQVKI